MNDDTMKKTDKTLHTFALASFLNDMGSDMIYPVWPLFVASLTGGNMALLGLLDGLGDAIVSLSQAVSGYLSDRLGKRKVFVWLGYLMGSLSRIGYAFSRTWTHLIPFRVLDRAGKIRGAPRDAIIADISTDRNRAGHFGLLRAMDNLGAVAGILICIFLVDTLGFRALFALAAIPSFLGVVIVYRRIREQPEPQGVIYRGFAFRHVSQGYWLFLALNAVFSLGAFSYSFLLISAQQHGFSKTGIPVLYLLFSMIAAMFSLPFGRLADRIGRKAVFGLALLFWVAVCVVFAFNSGKAAIIAGFALYGFHKAALEPVQRTLAAELAPAGLRASGLGTFQMAVGLCALPASLTAGLLWDRVGTAAPFMLGLGLTILSLLLLLLVKEVRTR
jgi:MFS family permease